MNQVKLVSLALMTLMSEAAFAGGLLTNTNQNIIFLRNPARDGAIGIDGVYSNPAGVAFLGKGLQCAECLSNANHPQRHHRTLVSEYALLSAIPVEWW